MKTANLVDYDTGLVTCVRYLFGRLSHTGFENDSLLDNLKEDGTSPEEIQEMVRTAEENFKAVAGRFPDVKAAISALIDSGYDPIEVYELER